jgi:hypothetical protein
MNNDEFEEVVIESHIRDGEEVTVDTEIRDELNRWNIPGDFVIEDEAKQMLLLALQQPNIAAVYLDEEKGLCIDLFDDENINE